MIVKNEAHIIHELIEAVAPYIDYWVIVDTGSQDGTQDLIQSKMAALKIPGELFERPWRDFGSNRTEALELAQGRCDYIWVMDADDTVIGRPDFNDLQADGYELFIEFENKRNCWRLQLFRDGVPWRYAGAIHEFAICDRPHTRERLEGDYRILARALGGRSLEPGNKYERDRDVLLAELRKNPDDQRSAFYLARMYECLHDYASARDWYARRAEMGGWDEEVYHSLFKMADMAYRLGEPWTDVMHACLAAWEFRPTRADGLYSIACHYRASGDYELGYLFASRAAEIPLPDSDVIEVDRSLQWRAMDELAVCASWIGKQAESMGINRQLLARNDVPEEERKRILANRDSLATFLLEESAASPPDFARFFANRHDAEVTVSLIGGPDRAATERTLNSFLRCCTDFSRIGRFIVIDAGLAASDREFLASRYADIEFLDSPSVDLGFVREQVAGRYWLHLWQGWVFFTEEPLITRLVDVLESESDLVQVGINFDDAVGLGPENPARESVRFTQRGFRYVMSDIPTAGPAMFDMTRLSDDAGLAGVSATLDEVLCVYSLTS